MTSLKMKLAFTTLGCPGWDINTIIAKALEYGFNGVDFRGYRGELNIFNLPEFTTKIKETAKRFAEAKVEVPCFSSSAHIFSPTFSEEAKNIEEVRLYARIAEYFQSSFIRVFGGAIGNTPRNQAINITVNCFKKMVKVAKKYNVKLLLETHDDWMNSHHLKAIMEQTKSDSVGILWDIHHPYRIIGETPLKTWQTIGKWVQYTHWKDSFLTTATKDGHQLCLLGEGDIPLKEIFAALKRGDYQGYLTLEWEKRWHSEIEEPEVAFPRYIEFMKKLLSRQ